MVDNFPLRLLLATFGGWVNRRQAQAIEYLVEENRVLKEHLGNNRLRLTDDQRRRLAAKGKPLGRRLLDKVATIVTPDTILRWHRKLIAAHHTYPHKTRLGRPGLMKSIRELIVRMATENASWGYLRIQGEMQKVGHCVARTTIAATLKNNGIAPSPDRPTSWGTFLKSHADVIAAADFFTVDVWTKRGLVTHYVLFVIHHATRAVHIAGVTPHPNSAFMAQVARNLTDSVDGFLHDMQFLVVDNDTLFTKQFCGTLAYAGVEVTRTAIQAPNMNAFAERWVQTVKRECLSKLILFGERHLRRALNEFVAHYHKQRPHQGIRNDLIEPSSNAPPNGDRVVVDERLGGLLRSYRRTA
jgi:transposase InsO family protein